MNPLMKVTSSKSWLIQLSAMILGFGLIVGAMPVAQAADSDDVAGEDSGPPPTPSTGPTTPTKGSKTGVLDFEGDVIEGQRKRPDLFLQTEIDSLSLDAILYLRKDFNDFHQVDKNRRPGYFQRRTRKTR